MVKDMFRMMLAEMFAGMGFDHEIALQRFQFGIALIGSSPFSTMWN